MAAKLKIEKRGDEILIVLRETKNTNFIVFGLIWLGLEITISRGDNANYYTTDAVNC